MTNLWEILIDWTPVGGRPWETQYPCPSYPHLPMSPYVPTLFQSSAPNLVSLSLYGGTLDLAGIVGFAQDGAFPLLRYLRYYFTDCLQPVKMAPDGEFDLLTKLGSFVSMLPQLRLLFVFSQVKLNLSHLYLSVKALPQLAALHIQDMTSPSNLEGVYYLLQVCTSIQHLDFNFNPPDEAYNVAWWQKVTCIENPALHRLSTLAISCPSAGCFKTLASLAGYSASTLTTLRLLSTFITLQDLTDLVRPLAGLGKLTELGFSSEHVSWGFIDVLANALEALKVLTIHYLPVLVYQLSHGSLPGTATVQKRGGRCYDGWKLHDIAIWILEDGKKEDIPLMDVLRGAIPSIESYCGTGGILEVPPRLLFHHWD